MHAIRTEPLAVGILALRGDWDFSLEHTLVEIFAQLERADVAILYLANVTFGDSVILAVLIRLHKNMKSAGGRGQLKIVKPTATFRRVLEICDLDTVFTVCDSMAEATSDLADNVVVYMGSASGTESLRFPAYT